MNKLLTLLAATALALQTVYADEASLAGDPPKPPSFDLPPAGDQPKPPGFDAPPAGEPPKPPSFEVSPANDQSKPPGLSPGAPAAEGDNKNRREDPIRRMIEENPELKGVDLESSEGQEKVDAVMAKRIETAAPKIRQRMAEYQASQHTELSKALGMAPEEFDAIKPLLVRVENLRLQKSLVDNIGHSIKRRTGSRVQRSGQPSLLNAQMLLGDTPLDPTVQEIQEAGKALEALVDDKQTNAAELASSVARLRKARQGFDLTFVKVQEELRAKLTPQQEAILVDNWTLD